MTLFFVCLALVEHRTSKLRQWSDGSLFVRILSRLRFFSVSLERGREQRLPELPSSLRAAKFCRARNRYFQGYTEKGCLATSPFIYFTEGNYGKKTLRWKSSVFRNG